MLVAPTAGIAQAREKAVQEEITTTTIATINARDLKVIIDQVAFAAAKEPYRPALTGVLIRRRGNDLIFVATDGIRLAVRTITLDDGHQGNMELIVPAKWLTELARALGRITDDVEISTSSIDTQVRFRVADINAGVSTMPYVYPDYQRIIPVHSTTRCAVNTADLLKVAKEACKQASTFKIVKLAMREFDKELRIDVREEFKKDGKNAAREVNIAALPAEVDGNTNTIVLDARYFRDAVAAIKSERVAIEMQGPRTPAVIMPVDGHDYTTLVMTMARR